MRAQYLSYGASWSKPIMLNLAGKEKQASFNAARKIQTYKFVQDKDYRKLIKKYYGIGYV
jgi:hypothetical protein